MIHLFKTTKFHLTRLSGLAIQQYTVGVLCAQKPTIKWNFERQKPLYVFVLTQSCHPSLMDGF